MKGSHTLVQHIMFFGDSMTAGQYVPPRYRWTSLASDALEDRFPSQFDVEVRAISGETSREAPYAFRRPLLRTMLTS